MVKYLPPLDENIVLRFLHIHSFAHFIKSFFKPITHQDFYHLRESYRTESLLNDYDKIQRESKRQHESLIKTLFKMFKREMVAGIVMSFIVALLLIESPIIMKKILLHIADPDATSEQTQAVKGVIKMYVIVFVIKIFFNELTERKFFMIGLRVQLLLTNLFMRKISRISVNDLPQSKPEVMNYLIVEIKKIETFFKKGSWLFSQPPVLILGVLILLFKNFWLGFLILEIIFGFVVIKILTQNQMQNSHHHKTQIQQQRIYRNVEFIKQIKQMKTIGYGSLLAFKQMEYVKQQNHYNLKYMASKHIIECFLVLIPFVFYLIYFIQRLRTQSLDSLGLVDSYIVLIYTQTLIAPLKNIRYISTYLEDLVKALNQLESFLSIPELERLIYTNRDLTLSSLRFSNIKIDRDNLKSEEVEKSGAQYFLSEKNNPVTSPGRKIKNYIKIPFSIELKAGDHLVMLGEKDEGSVLLSLLAGNIKLDEGMVEYNGKIAYVSSELWLAEGTIRDNVLMGQIENQNRLKLVYEITDLSTDFEIHLSKGDLTKISSFSLTENHKRRISLARALYIDADIYLFDNIFQGVPRKITEKVYKRLSEYLSQRTMIVAAKTLELLPNDKILLFINRPKTVEYGNLQKLKSAENQNLKTFMQKMEDQSQEESITIQQQKQHHQRENYPSRREQGVPLATYKQFLSYGSLRVCLSAGVLIVLIEIFKLYLDLILGGIHQSNNTKTESSSVSHYVTMLVILFTLQVSFSVLQLITSKRLSEKIVLHLTTSIISNISVEELEGQHQTSLIEIISKDYQQLFVLIHRLPALISYNMILFITIFLLLFCNPRLFVYILGLMAFNVVFFYFLLRTQREITSHKSKIVNSMYENVYSFIEGVETIKHYADPKQFYIQKSKYVTDYAVYIQNQRFVWHAVKMIGEVTTLMMTYWTIQFAVGKRKGLNQENIVFLFVAISYCLKLGGLITYIIEEFLEIESGFKKVINKMLSIINDKPENDSKAKPAQILLFDMLKIKGESQSDFMLFANDKMALYGQRSKISSLYYQLTRTTKPNYKVDISINGVHILSIPMATIYEKMFHFTANPFVFSGTVHQNIDPYQQHKPSQVYTAIKDSGLLLALNETNELKASQIVLVYQQIHLSVRNAINLARVILRTPEVLLIQSPLHTFLNKTGLKTFKQIIEPLTAVFSNPDETLKALCNTNQSL